ncbi:hypothetical protein JWG39_12735 [Desulforhopalus vacuolatus]|uniref:PGPGW domain-containing protein n=1 Tax=Desulforhopalus vacuolatus TaxID=40414 RepID=UPI001962F7F5|nr:PGPGW domain-containing protein [Desulforhopalus vacuolatus]MBM9520680.1 hypothetical protein [Desulforhopalus vacuolatus]
MQETLLKLVASAAPFFSFLAIASLITFLLSLLLIPAMIAHMPQDYFLIVVRRHQPARPGLVLLLIKNTLGALLVIAGIAMLFLPGQGLLTIILGLILLSFPGKQRLLLGLLTRPALRNSLNWIRRKTGRSEFRWPPRCRGDNQRGGKITPPLP